MAKKSAGKKKKAVKPMRSKPPFGVHANFRPFAPAKLAALAKKKR